RHLGFRDCRPNLVPRREQVDVWPLECAACTGFKDSIFHSSGARHMTELILPGDGLLARTANQL
ncbi:MAG TPA: hypothetical protein VGJ87_05650, partial [Roseiflexaceae bacterium]